MCSKSKNLPGNILDFDDNVEDGLEHLQDKCGIFACIANGDWPTNLDVAHIICLGLVGLQHRFVHSFLLFFFFFFDVYLKKEKLLTLSQRLLID